MERQITNIMRLVPNIGNRGTRLTDGWQRMGLAANMNDRKILALGSALVGRHQFARDHSRWDHRPIQVSPATSPRRYGRSLSTRTFCGGTSRLAIVSTMPWRWFCSSASRTLSKFRVGYTYSRLNNDGAESAQGGSNPGIQNPVSTEVGEYGLSADDVPHVFLVGHTWELPAGKRMKGSAAFLLGGRNLAGALRYESGRPLSIVMNNDLEGILFNGQKRPNRVKGANGLTPRNGNFNPYAQSYFIPGAWADPGPLPFGNAPPARRIGPWVPHLHRGHEYIQGLSGQGTAKNAVRS